MKIKSIFSELSDYTQTNYACKGQDFFSFLPLTSDHISLAASTKKFKHLYISVTNGHSGFATESPDLELSRFLIADSPSIQKLCYPELTFMS